MPIATEMRVSPPAISAQLKLLEDQLGDKLLMRSARRLVVTERVWPQIRLCGSWQMSVGLYRALRLPFIFPLAHRFFIASEMRLRAVALMERRGRVDVLATEPRPFRLPCSRAAIALFNRSRSSRNSVKI